MGAFFPCHASSYAASGGGLLSKLKFIFWISVNAPLIVASTFYQSFSKGLSDGDALDKDAQEEVELSG